MAGDAMHFCLSSISLPNTMLPAVFAIVHKHADVSESDDQGVAGSEGTTDEEGDWRPAKKQKAGRRPAYIIPVSKSKKKIPAAAAAAAAAAPPQLFRPKDPSKMTAAEKRAAALSKPRTIHVSGGQGGKTKSNNGCCTITLPPGV
jgi:hypothetical protein